MSKTKWTSYYFSANSSDVHGQKMLFRNENEKKNPLMCKSLTSFALVGLWPFQSEKFLNNKPLKTFHSYYGLFIFTSFCFFHLTQYMELFRLYQDGGMENLEDMTTNLTVTCFYNMAIVEVAMVFLKRKTLEELIEGASAIERRILQFQNEKIKSIMCGYIKRSRWVTYLIWSVAFGTIILFFTIPPFEYRFAGKYHKSFTNGTEYWTREKPTIFSSWFPFDRYSWKNYVAVYIFHMYNGSIGAYYLGSWDPFVISLMIHSIGQLKILQRKIVEITDLDEELKHANKLNLEEFRRMIETIQHRKLVECVVHHQYIFNYTRKFNKILRPVMVGHFLVCSMMICVVGFEATTGEFGLHSFLMAEYLFAVLVHSFFLYWSGNDVIVEQEKVFDATYSCKWYNSSKSLKTSLMIFRECMNIPLHYTVGPFYVMWFPVFVGILRTSYSYYALLRQMQNRE